MDAEVVYLIAEDRKAALDWAHRNKPRQMPKVFHPASTIGPRGLYINDVPVFIFESLGVDAHEAWAATGARLVYV